MPLSKAEIEWTGGEPDSDFRAGYRAAIYEVADMIDSPTLMLVAQAIRRLDDIDEPHGN